MSGGALDPAIPIVLLASAPWDTPAPVNVHQIARRLGARGRRVLFVESTGLRSPSLRSGHDRSRVVARIRAAFAGPRPVAPGVHALAPLAAPAGWSGLARRASDVALAASVRRALRVLELREQPLVWAFLPTWLGVARRLQPRGLVYHCVDRYAANPGVDRAGVEAAEDAMLRAADRVLVTSPVLLEHLRGRRPDAVCVPNVADVALFSRAARESLPEPPELVGLPRPRVVYTGNLARYRIDFDLLGGLADALPEVGFVLVGAVGLGDPGGAAEAFAALAARSNVHAFPAVAQAALPDWLAHVDAALIPFLDNEHTRASLPLKLWEYVAAGLPVVATELPHFASLAAEAGVRTASGVDGFTAALRAALSEPPERRPERSQRATGHDWEARIDELLQLVDGAGGEGGVR